MTSIKRMLVDNSSRDSITSKVYIRSAKSGKVTKIVREIYLRTDIPCSSRLCRACLANAPVDSNNRSRPFVLSENPAGTTQFKHGHYLMPDTNIFLQCMDAIEHKSAFYDVIVLQTVLDEVKNQSLPLYNRLVSLTKSDEKRFYVFHNEFRQETHVKRGQEESINDRNDRAIRVACKWYREHIEQAAASSGARAPAVVMLSNDKANLAKAKGEGLDATSMNDYVKGLKNADELLDMISSSLQDFEKKANRGSNVYAEYFSVPKMNTGVRNGTLHQGTFHTSTYNSLEGTVGVPSFDKHLLIVGLENMNRAIDGDQVVVELLPQDQWKTQSDKLVDQDTLTKNENADVDEVESIVTEKERRALIDEAKRIQRSKDESQKVQPTAKVVGVLKRNWRSYVGHIDPNSVNRAKSGGQQVVFFRPLDKKIPRIRVFTRQATQLLGQRIVVNIDTWDRTSRFPIGHFVRALGELESKEAETEALLLEYDVQYRPFPKAVLDCLPSEGHDWIVPEKGTPGWEKRADLRDLLVCSIDPPGCQDIDDALHARLLPNGNYEAGVHIADVSHFVKPNNAMDDEAASRGTTVYLVDKRIDMLPPLLGTDLCSLKPYVERYAFSVIWEMTPDAKIVSTRFTKSVIKSREAFAYKAAQMRIDDKSQTDPLTEGMRILLMLSKKLKQARMDAGALNLASPEVKVHMESETSDPASIEVKELLETNSLVEEFMLCANISVARRIYEAFPQTAMLRRHGAPPATNFDDLRSQLRARKGLDLHVESSKALADSLDGCIDPQEAYFNTLVRIIATRCMVPAEYFSSGTQAYPEFRHYGLATDIYTHFTSPIRRYADLAAHRQLAAAIEYEALDESLYNKNKMDAVVKNINVRHRNAQFAGRASIEYYVGQALKNKSTEQEGFVAKIFSNGFVVFVPKFGIEGTIKVETAKTYDADEYILELEDGRKVVLFDKVKVMVNVVKEQATGRRKTELTLA
ncbi:exosome catalytic subunit dis3 [Arthrobotrys musiformis]|uniref:Ribosomal RNA-processing protein 44 n=1 Tax=Arthrobotrys musiformis TaxID=47236 RepID=A0AAV9WNJ4_9PEZI